MPIDDLWYLKERGPDKKRLKSKRYGRGKRWRVRYVDAAGEPRDKHFDRKTDAEEFDNNCRAGTAPEVGLVQAEKHITFGAYAARYREARNITWGLETRTRIESNLRLHLIPAFGNDPIRKINQTDVLLWLAQRLADGTASSSVRLYFELFDAVMAAAVRDKVREDNPCDGIKLSQVFRGLSRAPKWVPERDDVLRLFKVVPQRYHALLWLGAGAGMRIGEALGFEDGPRCLDPENEELHVIQQLRYAPREFEGGFHLSLPKGVRTFDPAGGAVDLDPVVAAALDRHRKNHLSPAVEMIDTTSGRPIRRRVPLMFTTVFGNPFTDRTWSAEWIKWRRAAGWPEDSQHSGFHALRHFFATTLIVNHVDPKEVQRALRHSTLQITLETYVHFWPRRTRKKGVVGEVLRSAADGLDLC
ncbi:tyrosine-type recombinase/integrase [Actinoplanes xinjiangensis]|uniref:tyrosine-type recombinase/integrase n=1 Tax=Actinoplanes xinjiangensis TaxID=512350 RepID=UPI003449F2CB